MSPWRCSGPYASQQRQHGSRTSAMAQCRPGKCDALPASHRHRDRPQFVQVQCGFKKSCCFLKVNKTAFWSLKAHLGRQRQQVDEQGGARSKKEASRRQKIWLYLRNFMFFEEALHHIHENTNQSRHWRVDRCRNRKAKKWSCHCKKGVELNIWGTQLF